MKMATATMGPTGQRLRSAHGKRPRAVDLERVNRAAARWCCPTPCGRRALAAAQFVEHGLRQWLRCCGAALRDGQIIGMPSHAVDEAWHGFILCTEPYAAFCDDAYGRFLHHHPEGGGDRGASDGVSRPARPHRRRLDTGRRAGRGVRALGRRRARRCRASRGASPPNRWRR